MIDIEILESGNGGEMSIAGNDIRVVTGYENMPYLSNFGGQNWWANNLLLNTNNDFEFNATTEQVLLTTPLNSNGRLIIIEAITNDLNYIIQNVPNTVINVTAKIVSDDRLNITISFLGLTFYYYWNPSSGVLMSVAGARVYVTEDGGAVYGTEDGSESYTWS